jgi:hypothetical protein
MGEDSAPDFEIWGICASVPGAVLRGCVCIMACNIMKHVIIRNNAGQQVVIHANKNQNTLTEYFR